MSVAVAMTPLVPLACAPPDGGSVAAPTTFPAPPSDPKSSLEATKQTIIDTYTGLWPAIKRAERAPAERRREILSPYVANPELGSLLDQIADHRQRGIVTYGRAIVHVFDVEIDRRTAVLHDCQDTRRVGQRNEETGEKLTRGIKQDHAVATLRRVSEGEWRVKKIRRVKEPCSAAT